MATYVYDKLDPTFKQIRICTIHPGSFDDPIRCSLHTVSLDDYPEYETLSYAWGAPVFDHTLLIDGIALNVTKNLHNAMRYLRPNDETVWDPKATGVLWADAVCIDQTNEVERASQVALMGDVYRRSNRLHIWIGTPEEIREDLRHRHPVVPELDDNDRAFSATAFSTDALTEEIISSRPTPLQSASLDGEIDADVIGAMEILKLLAEDKHVHQLPCFKVTSIDAKLEKDPHWYRSVAMLLGILTQPWWGRVWVVQEVLLSPTTQPPLLHISHHTIPFSDCEEMLKCSLRHIYGCCLPHAWLILASEGMHQRMEEVLMYLATMNRLRRSYDDGGCDMTSAQYLVYQRAAARPHDYIYGSRALMEGSPFSFFEVDYSKPVSTLYVEATRALFRSRGDISDIESAVGVDAENGHSLPSWCVDWTTYRPSVSDLDKARRLFNAACGSTHPFNPDEDDTSLTVEILAEGSITSVINVIGDLTVDPDFAVEQWIIAAGIYQDLAENTDTIIRVLLEDLTFDFAHIAGDPLVRRILPQDIEQFLESRQAPGSSGPYGPAEVNRDLWLSRMWKQWRFVFMTSQGLLGTGARNREEGDHVVIAKGSELPLILRPINASSDQQEQEEQIPSYQLVGMCYVHGIMDGEAVTADSKWETIRLY
ncbi:MAG: hypothetical protein Q9168_004905 [Polycauliona sp. 1 TL-2023]